MLKWYSPFLKVTYVLFILYYEFMLDMISNMISYRRFFIVVVEEYKHFIGIVIMCMYMFHTIKLICMVQYINGLV